MLPKEEKVRQGRPFDHRVHGIRPYDLAVRRASSHCGVSPRSSTHFSRYEASNESPLIFKIPAASSIWRWDSPSLAHSSLARIMSSALATCSDTPSTFANCRLPNSSRLKARDLRIIMSIFHEVFRSMMLNKDSR